MIFQGPPTSLVEGFEYAWGEIDIDSGETQPRRAQRVKSIEPSLRRFLAASCAYFFKSEIPKLTVAPSMIGNTYRRIHMESAVETRVTASLAWYMVLAFSNRSAIFSSLQCVAQFGSFVALTRCLLAAVQNIWLLGGLKKLALDHAEDIGNPRREHIDFGVLLLSTSLRVRFPAPVGPRFNGGRAPKRGIFICVILFQVVRGYPVHTLLWLLSQLQSCFWTPSSVNDLIGAMQPLRTLLSSY